MPKPNENQVFVSKLVLDKVLLAVDAQGYVDLLDPVRVRELVGLLPDGVRYWLLGADGECPKLCEAEHWGPDEEAAEAPEPVAPLAKTHKPRKPRNAVNEQAAAKADEKPSDEDLAAVREFMSGELVSIHQMRACVGWPDDEQGYARAGAALCHLRDVLREVTSVDYDDPAKGGLHFRLGAGHRIRHDYDGLEHMAGPASASTEEPARSDVAPASEEDVLGAMLEGKPQTVSQIASFLELGVARVAPTIEALVVAGKVEQAKTKGRYAQFQKVAS